MSELCILSKSAMDSANLDSLNIVWHELGANRAALRLKKKWFLRKQFVVEIETEIGVQT